MTSLAVPSPPAPPPPPSAPTKTPTHTPTPAPPPTAAPSRTRVILLATLFPTLALTLLVALLLSYVFAARRRRRQTHDPDVLAHNPLVSAGWGAAPVRASPHLSVSVVQSRSVSVATASPPTYTQATVYGDAERVQGAGRPVWESVRTVPGDEAARAWAKLRDGHRGAGPSGARSQRGRRGVIERRVIE